MSEGKVCPLPGAAGSFPMPCVPGWPKLRAGTQLDAIYERMLREGNGFVRPGSNPDIPKWSRSLIRSATGRTISGRRADFSKTMCTSSGIQCACRPTTARLRLQAFWPRLTPGACSASTRRPLPIRLLRHSCRGLSGHAGRPQPCLNNARIFRKSGGTQVPLGIFRKLDGTLVPLFGDNTAEEMRRVIGI